MFYKLGTHSDDKYSHLKIAVWVGLVMGVCGLALLPFAESSFSFGTFFRNTVSYLPASACYIASMVIGYVGLRYLELSIVSPVQNASGALASVVMIIYFVAFGKYDSIGQMLLPTTQNVFNLIGTVVIVVGVILLAVVENKTAQSDNDGKFRYGALALLFPLAYCLFDTIGTAADGIILDEVTGLGLGEIDVIILYGFTFFVVGLGCWIFLWIKQKHPYNPFALAEVKTKGVAALCEEFGQVFYVYAMASNPVVASPMIASYCIVSVILSRVFLHEKLSRAQYACVFTVIAGIVLLGLSEGLA